MSIVQGIQTKWNNMSKGQKVATVAGAAVGTAAVASAVAAGVMGKKLPVDSFTLKEGKTAPTLLQTIGAGYKKMGSAIVDAGKKSVEWVKGLFNKKGSEAPAAPQA